MQDSKESVAQTMGKETVTALKSPRCAVILPAERQPTLSRIKMLRRCGSAIAFLVSAIPIIPFNLKKYLNRLQGKDTGRIKR
ncbi:MAG: hypothetical protein ACOXZ2_02105 [Sphaerochaetaceae bacterium]